MQASASAETQATSAPESLSKQRYRFYENARDLLAYARDPEGYLDDYRRGEAMRTADPNVETSPSRTGGLSDGGDSRVNDTKQHDAAVRLQMFVASRVLLKNYFLAIRMREEEAAEREQEAFRREEAGRTIALFLEARVTMLKRKAAVNAHGTERRNQEDAASRSPLSPIKTEPADVTTPIHSDEEPLSSSKRRGKTPKQIPGGWKDQAADQNPAPSASVVSADRLSEANPLGSSATRYSDIIPSDDEDAKVIDDANQEPAANVGETTVPSSENLIGRLLGEFETKETVAAVKIQGLARQRSARRLSSIQGERVGIVGEESNARADIKLDEEEECATIYETRSRERQTLLARGEARARLELSNEREPEARQAVTRAFELGKLESVESTQRTMELISAEVAERKALYEQLTTAEHELRQKEESDMLLQVVSSTIDTAFSTHEFHGKSAIKIQAVTRRHQAQVQELSPRRMTRAIATDERVEREIVEMDEGDAALVLDVIGRELVSMWLRLRALGAAIVKDEEDARCSLSLGEDTARCDTAEEMACDLANAIVNTRAREEAEEEEIRVANESAATVAALVGDTIEVAKETSGKHNMSAIKIQSAIRGHQTVQQQVSPRRAMTQLCSVDERVERELVELAEEDEWVAVTCASAEKRRLIMLQSADAAEEAQRGILRSQQTAERSTILSIARTELEERRDAAASELPKQDEVSPPEDLPRSSSSLARARRAGNNSPHMPPAPVLQGIRADGDGSPARHASSGCEDPVSRELNFSKTTTEMSPPPEMRFLRGEQGSPRSAGSVVSLDKRLRSVLWTLDALAEGALHISSTIGDDDDKDPNRLACVENANALLDSIGEMFASPEHQWSAEDLLSDWHIRFSDYLDDARRRVKAYQNNATAADLQVVMVPAPGTVSSSADSPPPADSLAARTATMLDGSSLSATQRGLLEWPSQSTQQNLLCFSERRDRAAIIRLARIAESSIANLWSTAKSLAEEVSECMTSAYVTRDRQLRLSDAVSTLMSDEVSHRIKIKTLQSLERDAMISQAAAENALVLDETEREPQARAEIVRQEAAGRATVVGKASSRVGLLRTMELHLYESVLLSEEAAARTAIAKVADHERQAAASALSTALCCTSERQLLASAEQRFRITNVIQPEAAEFALLVDRHAGEREATAARKAAEQMYDVMSRETKQRRDFSMTEQRDRSTLMQQLADMWTDVLNGYVQRQEFMQIVRDEEGQRWDVSRDETRLRRVLGERFDEITEKLFASFLDEVEREESTQRRRAAQLQEAARSDLISASKADAAAALQQWRSTAASAIRALADKESDARVLLAAECAEKLRLIVGPFARDMLRHIRYEFEPQARASILIDEAQERSVMEDLRALMMNHASYEVLQRISAGLASEQNRQRQLLARAEAIEWEFMARRGAAAAAEIQRRLLIVEQELDFWGFLQRTIDDSSPMRSRAASAALAKVGDTRPRTAEVSEVLSIPQRILEAKAAAAAAAESARVEEVPLPPTSPPKPAAAGLVTPKRPVSAVLPQRPPGPPVPTRPQSSNLRRDVPSSALDSQSFAKQTASRPVSCGASFMLSRPGSSNYSDYGGILSDSPGFRGGDSPDSSLHHIRSLFRILYSSVAHELTEPENVCQQRFTISLEDLMDVFYAVPTFKLTNSQNPNEASTAPMSGRLARLWCDATFPQIILSKLKLINPPLADGNQQSESRLSPCTVVTLEHLCYAIIAAIPIALEGVTEFDFNDFCSDLAVNGVRKMAQCKGMRNAHALSMAFAAIDIHGTRLIPRQVAEEFFCGLPSASYTLWCQCLPGYSFAGFVAALVENNADNSERLLLLLLNNFYDRFVWPRVTSARAKREKLVQLGLLNAQVRSAAEELLAAVHDASAALPGSKHRTFAPEELYGTSRLVESLGGSLSDRDTRTLLNFTILSEASGLFGPGLPLASAEMFATVLDRCANFSGAVPPPTLTSSLLGAWWQKVADGAFLATLRCMAAPDSGASTLSGSPVPAALNLLQFGHISTEVVELVANARVEIPESLAANDRAQVDLYRYKRIQQLNAVLLGLRHLLLSLCALLRFWRFTSGARAEEDEVVAARLSASGDKQIEAETILASQIRHGLTVPQSPASPFTAHDMEDADDHRDAQVISKRFADVLFGMGGGSFPVQTLVVSPPKQPAPKRPLPPPPPPADVRPAWASPRTPSREEAPQEDHPRAPSAVTPAAVSPALPLRVSSPVHEAPRQAVGRPQSAQSPLTAINHKVPTQPPPAQRPQTALPLSSAPTTLRDANHYVRLTNASPAPHIVSPDKDSKPSGPPLATAGSSAVRELLRIFAQPVVQSPAPPRSTGNTPVQGKYVLPRQR
jgi:hypothetical protein